MTNTPEVTENTESSKIQQKGKGTKRKIPESDSRVETKIRKMPERKAKTNPKRDQDFVYRVQKNQSELEENTEESEDSRIHAIIATINNDPVNFREALESKDREKWLLAVHGELQSMIENDVWEIVDRPAKEIKGKRTNLLDSKWIFKKKKLENGEEKFKARLVIRGFRDKNNYELRETYAPVSRLALIRAVLAVINKMNLEAVQLDVKTAFLNGVLEDDIYMEIPVGTEHDEHTRRTKVCKLKKTLYGLKVSSKKWYERFTKEAKRLGLERDINDPCLFTWRKDGLLVILVLYVDDIILASNSPEKLHEIKSELCKTFEMKDLGEPRTYLEMKIERDRENKILKLSQSEYTERILERFNMKECKAQNTPMVTRQVKNRELRASENIAVTRENDFPYREAIGSLLYLAGTTRPDISFAVNYLSRKQMSPTDEDWKEVKRIFRYLRGTTQKGLTFRAQNEILEGYTDASFRDQEDSHSTSGYVIRVFGDTVAWRSHKQPHVGISTCLAEYMSMTEVCQELISLDKALRDMTGYTLYPATVRCDNKSAIACTQMDGSNKLKAFDDDLETIQRKLREREISGHKERIREAHGDYIKSCVNQNRVKVQWVESKENIADIMTKPLPKPSHVS